VFKLVEIGGINGAPELVFAVRNLDGAAASLAERALECRDDLTQGNTALAHQRRNQAYLILLLEPADRRDLGDAGGLLQRRFHRALVEQPQLAQIVRPFLVHQRVLEDPANAARVRADHHVGIGG